MGKMLDNFRAWWNSVADALGDPGKLAQLSVADLERAVRKAKEAAAPVIGRPEALADTVKELEKNDEELSARIIALLNSGPEGEEAARKYVGRQVAVRKQLADTKESLADASAAASEWHDKIRVLEHELYSRRNEANRLQAEYEVARAEQQLGRQLQTADSLADAGSDKFNSVKARVEREKAKAAGYSAMSGLSDRAKEEKLISQYETDELMKEYRDKVKK
jgi:phage shock protein A